MHPACFRPAYPDRDIRNLYFDTPDLSSFRENLMGISERKKIRLRWYGTTPEILREAVLEIKIKNNQLGRKRKYILKSLRLQPLGEVTQKVNELINTHGELSPVMHNAFRRSYYSTANGRFRLTVDSALCFQAVGRFQHQFASRGIFRIPRIIVELKYRDDSSQQLDEVLQFLPFRQSKSSKYATGISLIMG